MRFYDFLKSQLVDFVEVYRKFLWRTFGTAFLFSIITLTISAILVRYTPVYKGANELQISLLSYFFTRFSYQDVYVYLDLIKTIFLFFVSVFSVALIRLWNKNNEGEITFSNFLGQLKLLDLLVLIFVLLLGGGFDYASVMGEHFCIRGIEDPELVKWIHGFIFHLRIYVPLFLFAIAIRRLTTENKAGLSLKSIIFLLLALWMFNEFAFEVTSFIRTIIFRIILVSAVDEKRYIFESFLGLLLIPFYFLGYFSAMTFITRRTSSTEPRIDISFPN